MPQAQKTLVPSALGISVAVGLFGPPHPTPDSLSLGPGGRKDTLHEELCTVNQKMGAH